MKSLRPPALAALALLALPVLLATHCSVDRAPDGLRATPDGTGPLVVFDLERRPLPEIPQPNDVATFPDPTSRTGRRINVSAIAPTYIEEHGRQGFGEMEGWGTFAPITVAFQRAKGADPSAPAIDLDDVRARMHQDGHDFTNDPIYIVNLTTGVPVMVDMGDGAFPLAPRDLDAYWPNDPKASEQNLLFETVEEGAGLTQADYSPSLDLDFDGVLDHPNTLAALASGVGGGAGGGVKGVDDLLTWYERETDTLIVRPLLPMEEKTEYAVVLTDRLHGSNGQPVRSPFPFIHHPQQKDDVAKVAAILGDPARANYYGDLAGTGLAHVAFAWTFTTQPVYEDMLLLRNGLYGRGPFAYFADRFPPKVEAFRATGLSNDPSSETPGEENDPACAPVWKWPYAVNVGAAADMVQQLIQIVVKKVFNLEPGQEQLLLDSVKNIDHFVMGQFPSPYLLGDDPAHENADDWFHLNYKTGEGRVASDLVHFYLSVPKAKAGFAQPFPVVVWAHGTSLFDEESVLRAGYFARQGIATLAIDMPGHGLVLDKGLEQAAQIFLRGGCYVEWINGLSAGRAHDVNGDGAADSGGLLWTSHVFHSRDNIRQSVLDELQAVRVLRSFDGKTRSDQDFNGDGAPDLAGDFDGDGTPDVGGTSAVYTSGNSFGGIIAMIDGALDPYVSASAPISGAGGLTDIAEHSSLVPTPVLQQILSPLVVALPATERGPTDDAPTACADGQSTLRFVVNDLFKSREIEIACLDASELGPAMTVMVTNLVNKETSCARTTTTGGAATRLRLPIAANIGDRIQIQVFNQADAVDSYKTCNLIPNAPGGRRINTWEQAAKKYGTTADGSSCTADQGCAQFREAFFPVGSPLVAPQEGFGLARQTPEVRRLFNLTQAALDPADPINFANRYMLRSIPGLDGEALAPRGILISNTVGDPYVPTGAGIAFARAAGAVPFLPPLAVQTMPEYADYATPQPMIDAFEGTPNDVLVANHVVEGLARLRRTHAGAACNVNFQTKPPAVCGAPPAVDPDTCAQTLYDADWHSEGTNRLDAPHPRVPLRLARLTSVRATDAASLARSWAPRLGVLDPASKDGDAAAAPLIGLVSAYVNPLGQHVFAVNDPCRAFDDVTYYDTQMIRFLATGGRDVYPLSHPQTHKCMATQSCPFETP